MQLANVTVRLGGSLLNTVPKIAVTPAEVLVLQHLHGADAVVDVRPISEAEIAEDYTVEDGYKNPGTLLRRARSRSEQEFARLAAEYDPSAGGMAAAPGANDEASSIMSRLFPGALKKLPTTFAEIGIAFPDEPAPAPVPDLPPVDEAEEEVVDEETANEDNASDDKEGGDTETPVVDNASASDGAKAAE